MDPQSTHTADACAVWGTDMMQTPLIHLRMVRVNCLRKRNSRSNWDRSFTTSKLMVATRSNPKRLVASDHLVSAQRPILSHDSHHPPRWPLAALHGRSLVVWDPGIVSPGVCARAEHRPGQTTAHRALSVMYGSGVSGLDRPQQPRTEGCWFCTLQQHRFEWARWISPEGTHGCSSFLRRENSNCPSMSQRSCPCFFPVVCAYNM